jgi:predicted transcriptional regulator
MNEGCMSDTDRVLFLSLRPRFADLLLSGEKTVELRRIRPRAIPGMLVIVYAASPTRAALGTCVVEDIGSSTPTEIWRLHGARTGLRRAEFRDYFANAKRAIAITVTHPRTFAEAVPLELLRSSWLGFQPPQSFRYVSANDVADLLALAGVGDAPRRTRSAHAAVSV